MHLVNRADPPAVALETTLLVHGVPAADAPALAVRLDEAVRAAGATPAVVGLVAGVPIVGLTDAELAELLATEAVAKANTTNLGVLMHRRAHGATTVSATVELAAAAGVRVFATGGLGGVHRGYGTHWDVSADLAALTRFPVAVVASGVKSLLDVVATREALETLGVPVVGYRCDRFPAFYRRESDAGLDARFDDPRDLAAFVAAELARTRRGVLVANPIPEPDELPAGLLEGWIARAHASAVEHGVTGRGVTPHVLAHLHEISAGRTLAANIALALANARLAGEIAVSLPARPVGAA